MIYSSDQIRTQYSYVVVLAEHRPRTASVGLSVVALTVVLARVDGDHRGMKHKVQALRGMALGGHVNTSNQYTGRRVPS